MTFDDVHYKKYRSSFSLYIYSKFNNKNERCLKLNDSGITQITLDKNSERQSSMSFNYLYIITP